MENNYYDIIGLLPEPENNRQVIIERQEVNDIINEVLEAHNIFKKDYDLIYPFFYSTNDERFLKNIFDFCKKNIAYKIESENNQTSKSPAVLLAEKRGDCKHYAGFIGGVIDAANRYENKKISWFYRFASYNYLDNVPGHVFIVVKESNREIWIDPVLNSFNSHFPVPKYFKDYIPKKNKMISRISGVNSNELLEPVKELVYYKILDRDGNLNKGNYLATLKSLDHSNRESLMNSYNVVSNNLHKISGWVGDVFGVLSTIFGGNKTQQAPPPPPPPPTFMQTYGKYIPFVIVGGVGLYLYFDSKKRRRRR